MNWKKKKMSRSELVGYVVAGLVGLAGYVTLMLWFIYLR